MTPAQAADLTRGVAAWVAGRDDLLGLAVAGSWARGDARPLSDLDLVVLAADPEPYRRKGRWMHDVGLAAAGFALATYESHNHGGGSWTRHAYLRPWAALDVLFVPPPWAAVEPADAGARRLVAGGFGVVVDKGGLLGGLARHVTGRAAVGWALSGGRPTGQGA